MQFAKRKSQPSGQRFVVQPRSECDQGSSSIPERARFRFRPRGFSCRDQFLTLAFAQLTFHEGLRDIETCLRALGLKLDLAGFRGRISRSTLADANSAHDWRVAHPMDGSCPRGSSPRLGCGRSTAINNRPGLPSLPLVQPRPHARQRLGSGRRDVRRFRRHNIRR
ncbi:MAG: DUF4372 domain-containing protein [Planctomyces sp.]|nr:DUF4372 domain-containing protein [Planctomyces sp.]